MRNIKDQRFVNRKARVKAKMRNGEGLPRLSVYRSNKGIMAQIIDDLTEKTLVSFSDKKIPPKADQPGAQKKKFTKTEKAGLVGEELARLAKGKKISKVRFDRSGYKYHGRVKALAEGARKGGLVF